MTDFKIKPELIENYKQYMGLNCCDPYSFVVVRGVVAVMSALDAGSSPEEAERALHGLGLTGYMAGAAATAVVGFHQRGEEFRLFWNSKWGVTDVPEGAIVNPAIINIDIKESAPSEETHGSNTGE